MAYTSMYGGGDGQRRQKLAQALMRGGPSAQRVMGAGGGAMPMFGGLGRGVHSSVGNPDAPTPQLTYNPFLAQLQRGVGGLEAPTAQARQQISDLAGHAPAVPAALQQQGGAPVPQGVDNTPGAANAGGVPGSPGPMQATPQTSIADLTASSGMSQGGGATRFLMGGPLPVGTPQATAPDASNFDLLAHLLSLRAPGPSATGFQINRNA